MARKEMQKVKIFSLTSYAHMYNHVNKYIYLYKSCSIREKSNGLIIVIISIYFLFQIERENTCLHINLSKE